MKEKVNQLVELRDILPSLIDFATEDEIKNIDGKSIRNLMIKDNDSKHSDWRTYIHGEHVLGEYSNQYILGEEWKYIWMTQTGDEQLFNLINDSGEKNDLANEEEYIDILVKMRNILITELKDRPEGFVEDNKLISGKKQQPTIKKIGNCNLVFSTRNLICNKIFILSYICSVFHTFRAYRH